MKPERQYFLRLTNGMKVTIYETNRSHIGFDLRCLGTLYRVGRGRNRRWYISRIVSGRITDGASYASRRSARRAILNRIRRGDV